MAEYIVKSGDTISQILKDAGNPNYNKASEWTKVKSDYNNIEVGEKLNLPSFGAASAPASTPAPTTTTIKPPAAKEQVDPYLAEWQAKTAESMSNTEFDPFSTGEFDTMKGQLLAGVETPEVFSAEQLAASKSELMGVPGMEEELNSLKDELRTQEATRRARVGETRGEVSRMGAIEGRVGEVERQEAERMDTINRMIAYKQDQLNTAYGAIEFMINLKQIDYDNGMRMFSTQLDANISMYKQLRSDFESDRTFEQALIQDQRDHATATLQIYTNLITSGNMTYAGLDSGTKTELKKLEVQSGLGSGFIANLQMTPGADIQSITQSEEADGYTYANILRVDAGGNITVEKKRLGRFYVAPKSAPSATKPTEGEASSSFIKNSSKKGTKEYNATVNALSKYGSSVPGVKGAFKITSEQQAYSAISYLANTSNVSDEAAYYAVETVMRSLGMRLN